MRWILVPVLVSAVAGGCAASSIDSSTSSSSSSSSGAAKTSSRGAAISSLSSTSVMGGTSSSQEPSTSSEASTSSASGVACDGTPGAADVLEGTHTTSCTNIDAAHALPFTLGAEASVTICDTLRTYWKAAGGPWNDSDRFTVTGWTVGTPAAADGVTLALGSAGSWTQSTYATNELNAGNATATFAAVAPVEARTCPTALYLIANPVIAPGHTMAIRFMVTRN